MRLVLADDHVIVRMGIELLLKQKPDMEIVGTASDGKTVYEMAADLHPDIIVMDISMGPGEDGIMAARKISRDFPGIKVVMLSMHLEPEYLIQSIRAGASGYLIKNAPEDEIYKALQMVHAGGIYISEEMRPYLKSDLVTATNCSDGFEKLLDREIEILALVAKGYGNKEISAKLFISVKTVESYKTKIMTKLDLSSRPELVEFAIRHKLLR